MEGMRSGKNLQRAMMLLDEWETELAGVTQELELASIPRTNQLGHAQNLIALLDNADEEGRDSLRGQIKQQVKLLVTKIEVVVEGKPRTKNKKVYCTIHFKNGVKRRIWFQTGKDAVPDGLWSPDGRFPMEDMEAFGDQLLPLIDPADLTPEAIERMERRQEELRAATDAGHIQVIDKEA
jgi:hypothetical protein